jgi:hypothetical protein
MRRLAARLAARHGNPSPSVIRANRLFARLVESEPQAKKRLYREKKMRAAQTRDRDQLIDWMGRTYDRHYPKTKEQVLRPRKRPPGSPKK